MQPELEMVTRRIHEEPSHEEQSDAQESDGEVGIDSRVYRTDVAHHFLEDRIAHSEWIW